MYYITNLDVVSDGWQPVKTNSIATAKRVCSRKYNFFGILPKRIAVSIKKGNSFKIISIKFIGNKNWLTLKTS